MCDNSKICVVTVEKKLISVNIAKKMIENG
jgi:hypothetical protein